LLFVYSAAVSAYTFEAYQDAAAAAAARSVIDSFYISIVYIFLFSIANSKHNPKLY
jgi:hypothetical protein